MSYETQSNLPQLVGGGCRHDVAVASMRHVSKTSAASLTARVDLKHPGQITMRRPPESGVNSGPPKIVGQSYLKLLGVPRRCFNLLQFSCPILSLLVILCLCYCTVRFCLSDALRRGTLPLFYLFICLFNSFHCQCIWIAIQ